MNCKEFRDVQFDRYLDNEMNSNEIREFREHMENCPDCEMFFRTYRNLMDVQEMNSEYNPSVNGRLKFTKAIRRRKRLPLQLAAGFAIIAIALFGTKTFMDFDKVNQRYEAIVNKSVEMLNSAENRSGLDLSSKNAMNNDIQIRTERIYELINDGEN
jgi:predicted anti-sigma-YlaC factor YlaD